MPQFLANGCHRLSRNAARNDELEVVQVRVYVEGESVRRDAVRNVYADGGNLRGLPMFPYGGYRRENALAEILVSF